ncbi:glycosyltransferase family 2 protein [Paenibacillus silagei]|uniref:Glycosyltransferase involved in cell wall biosynthesis n=1 Tax=Paenibacillus silagei TaxID=1670801 RepID=A0ABS4NYQ6_9BACL|nr:glycosyltransferase family 2 protein [Paenibacillus silagei]MBP2114402.1 glycosyltransferase involved in cell wall biosynthesis [Paenibacillus silagei]
MMIEITIFTPTYNRKSTLRRLYQSLTIQSCYDFEWLVIDDGSTDGTFEYLEEISKKEEKFNIRYYRFSNGGKHRAINKGLDLAKGQYFFIVDSDDYLTNISIQSINTWIESISEEKKKFAGVSGLKGYTSSKMVGRTFNGNNLSCTALDTQKFNISGDKSEVYRTEIMREYRFPEIEGEKFITEAVVWNRIANDGFLIKYFNEINYVCEYREDGLTKKIDELFCSNFRGYTLYIKELIEFTKIHKVKIRAIMAYGYRGRLIKIPYKVMSDNIKISTGRLFVLTKIGVLIKLLRGFVKR